MEIINSSLCPGVAFNFLQKDSFCRKYYRNNRASGIKNIRCFPACREQCHTDQGYCGRAVKVEISSVIDVRTGMGHDLSIAKFSAQFECCDLRDTGSSSAHEIYFGETSKKGRSVYFLGKVESFTVLDLVENEFVQQKCCVSFNEEGKAFHYPWSGDRFKGRKADHAFAVSVHIPKSLADQASLSSSNYQVVAKGLSPLFQISCVRRKNASSASSSPVANERQFSFENVETKLKETKVVTEIVTPELTERTAIPSHKSFLHMHPSNKTASFSDAVFPNASKKYDFMTASLVGGKKSQAWNSRDSLAVLRNIISPPTMKATLLNNVKLTVTAPPPPPLPSLSLPRHPSEDNSSLSDSVPQEGPSQRNPPLHHSSCHVPYDFDPYDVSWSARFPPAVSCQLQASSANAVIANNNNTCTASYVHSRSAQNEVSLPHRQSKYCQTVPPFNPIIGDQDNAFLPITPFSYCEYDWNKLSSGFIMSAVPSPCPTPSQVISLVSVPVPVPANDIHDSNSLNHSKVQEPRVYSSAYCRDRVGEGDREGVREINDGLEDGGEDVDSLADILEALRSGDDLDGGCNSNGICVPPATATDLSCNKNDVIGEYVNNGSDDLYDFCTDMLLEEGDQRMIGFHA